MKKLIAFVIFALFAGLASASDPRAPFELRVTKNRFYGTVVFHIQAIDDNVVIRNVVINRGNCIVAPGTKSEISHGLVLKFGQRYSGYSNNCTPDDVKEIDVTGEEGTWTFRL